MADDESEAKQKMIHTLFNDPLKPLNLKSHYLTKDDTSISQISLSKGEPLSPTKIRRQNNISNIKDLTKFQNEIFDNESLVSDISPVTIINCRRSRNNSGFYKTFDAVNQFSVPKPDLGLHVETRKTAETKPVSKDRPNIPRPRMFRNIGKENRKEDDIDKMLHKYKGLK